MVAGLKALGITAGGSPVSQASPGLDGPATAVGASALAAGFSVFLALGQLLHWHHSHRRPPRAVKPLVLLVLLGEALHNFVGGLGIASTFLINAAAGAVAWLSAAAHELPQELGDFDALVHSGWRPAVALRWNVIAGLTFPLGGLLAWLLAGSLPLPALVLFAAGNFLYIAAYDLVPEIKAQATAGQSAQCFGWFASGWLLMWLLDVLES